MIREFLDTYIYPVTLNDKFTHSNGSIIYNCTELLIYTGSPRVSAEIECVTVRTFLKYVFDENENCGGFIP